MNVAQQGRREIEASRRHFRSRLPAGGAFRDALIHQALNALELDRSNDGTNIDSFVERWTDAEGYHAFAYLRDQWLSNTFLHEEP